MYPLTVQRFLNSSLSGYVDSGENLKVSTCITSQTDRCLNIGRYHRPLLNSGDCLQSRCLNTYNCLKDNETKLDENPVYPSVSSQPKDAFEELMFKIPSKTEQKQKANSKADSKADSKAEEIKQKRISPKSTLPASSNSKNEMEELKPIKKYTLIDLQIMARFHKIDTQKQGSGTKKINKTKEEMYNEIQEILERKK
jgi:hypothetical protein